MAEKAQSLAVPLGTHDCRLTDLPNDYYLSIPKLANHVKNVIADNEWYHGMTCEKFYIGKSHVHTWKGRTFDPHEPTTTWNREAVRSRWSDHRKRGFHNMAVLTVVTKDSLPPLKSRNPAVWKQQYTLALEQALITHFMFVEDDPRLENETTQPGKLEGGAAVGYVVYLAMKFSDAIPPPATTAHTLPTVATLASPRVKVEADWKIQDYPRACNDYTTGGVTPKYRSTRDPVTTTPSNVMSPITSNATPTSASSTQFPNTSTRTTTRHMLEPSPQKSTSCNTDGITTRVNLSSATSNNTSGLTTPQAVLQTAQLIARQETPPPRDVPTDWVTSTRRNLFPPSPPPDTVPPAPPTFSPTYPIPPAPPTFSSTYSIPQAPPTFAPTYLHVIPPAPPTYSPAPPTSTGTPTSNVTTHVYPVVPSWGNGVQRCKCGSTEHKTIAHHTCPLRKPCKCGSTTHQKRSHNSCPLNPRNQAVLVQCLEAGNTDMKP